MIAGVVRPDDATFERRAQYATTRSQYEQGVPKRIDVQDALNLVADIYDISKNQSDYVFVVARAVSAELPGEPNPNENGDAFPRDELLRFDQRLARRVYKTFDYKPNHINHRAENPRTARGFILDSTYNAIDPNDQFVECLLAIDASKDAVYADGIRSGAIDAFSMGCIAEHTVCSICGNKATNRMEFCNHISGNKMKTFDGKRAYEICGGVCFEELSAVDQPADPKALAQEILSVQAQIDERKGLGTESEILVLKARLNRMERELRALQGADTMQTRDEKKVAQMQPMAPAPAPTAQKDEAPMLPFAGQEEVPLAVDDDPMMAQAPPAPPPMPAPMAQAPMPAPTAQAPVPPPMPAAAQAPQPPPLMPAAQMMAPPSPAPAQAPPVPAPAPVTADDALQQYKQREQQEQQKPMTDDEIGVMAVTSRRLSTRYADQYADLSCSATRLGNFRVFNARTGLGLYAIRPPTKVANRKQAHEFCEIVIKMIAHYGLPDAMQRLKAVAYPKRAQVLEHEQDNLADPRGDQQPSGSDADDNMTDARPGQPSDTSSEADSNAEETPGSGPSTAIDERTTNMADADQVSSGELGSAKNPDSNMRDERDALPGVGGDGTLGEEQHDHDERVAKITAFFETRMAAVRTDADKRVAEADARAEKLANQMANQKLARFLRCMRLANLRQRLNHEESPLKIAMADALLTPCEINAQERWPGADIEVTAILVERGLQPGMPQHVESIIKSANELYKMDDRVLADTERLLHASRPIAIGEDDPLQMERRTIEAARKEARAVEGSQVPRGADSDQMYAMTHGTDGRRAALRGALGRPGFARMREAARTTDQKLGGRNLDQITEPT